MATIPEPKNTKQLADYMAWRFFHELRKNGTEVNAITFEEKRLAQFFEAMFNDQEIMLAIIALAEKRNG